MKLKAFLILALTASFLDADFLTDTKVTVEATNYNLVKVLRTHESVMMKLITQTKKMDDKIKVLQDESNTKNKRIDELEKLLTKYKAQTTAKNAVTQINTNSKYDAEFKKYLESNR